MNFLIENNIKPLNFLPYPAKASFLGGFVENLVKQVKLMIFSSISKKVLNYEHFHVFVKQCRMLLNKRPVGCKRPLSDQSAEFEAITPEMLVYGRQMPVISIIPQLQPETDYRPKSPPDSLFDSFNTLRNVKNSLESRYFGEFVQNLRQLGTDRPGRYKNSMAPDVKVNDLVTIRQNLCKPYNYPLGLVTALEKNDLGDVTSANIRKANGESVRRHISDIVVLDRCETEQVEGTNENLPPSVVEEEKRDRPVRQTAKRCRENIVTLSKRDLI